MCNAISWFEIPVIDLDRAQRFYETVLGRTLRREMCGEQMLAVFPHEDPAAGGCLHSSVQTPAQTGSGIRIYLDCMPGIDAALARVETAGGRVVQPSTALPEGMGYFAHLLDTEGNEVGLHAQV